MHAFRKYVYLNVPLPDGLIAEMKHVEAILIIGSGKETILRLRYSYLCIYVFEKAS